MKLGWDWLLTDAFSQWLGERIGRSTDLRGSLGSVIAEIKLRQIGQILNELKQRVGKSERLVCFRRERVEDKLVVF